MKIILIPVQQAADRHVYTTDQASNLLKSAL